MHMSEVVKNGFFLVTHSTGEVRIIEALIASRFRHILENAQLLIDQLLPIPRHLPHLREHIVLDVIALLRSQIAPGLLLGAQIGALVGIHVIPLIELLPDLRLLIRREILKRAAVLQNALALRR